MFTSTDYRTGHQWGLIAMYLLFEYVRPQDIFPFLRILHLPMIVLLLIFYATIRNKADLTLFPTKTFMALLCLLAIHVPLASNNYYAYLTSRSMVLIFIVYLGIVSLLKSEVNILKCFQWWMGVAVICAVKGYMEGGKIANSAFLGDENDFATFVIMMIPFSYFSIFYARKYLSRVSCIIFVILLVVAGISSMSRGGFVAMCVVSVFCWSYSARKVISSVFIVVGVCAFILFVPPEYRHEMQSIFDHDTYETGTGGVRLHLWRAGIRMFRDHPVIGVGGGNFQWRVIEYEQEGFRGRTHGGKQAHSIYLTLLPELGIVGTVLFAILILLPTLEQIKLNRSVRPWIKKLKRDGPVGKHEMYLFKRLERMALIQRGLWGGLVALLVNGAFLSLLYYPHVWIFIGFMVASNMAMRNILSEFGIVQGLEKTEPGAST